jgi:hypothetical protein
MKLVFSREEFKHFKKCNGNVKLANYVFFMTVLFTIQGLLSGFLSGSLDFEWLDILLVFVVALLITFFASFNFKYSKFVSDEMVFDQPSEAVDFYFPAQLVSPRENGPCGQVLLIEKKLVFLPKAIYSNTSYTGNVLELKFKKKEKTILQKLMYSWVDHEMHVKLDNQELVFHIPCPQKVERMMKAYEVI